MAQNTVNAAACGCGYEFDGDTRRNSRNALESIAEEERLYHDYLVARVTQAQDAAKTARKQAELDPDNHTKAADALFAEQALMTARGELAEQELRLRNAELHIQQKVFHRPKANAPAPKPVSGHRNTASVVHMARSAERKRVTAKTRPAAAPAPVTPAPQQSTPAPVARTAPAVPRREETPRIKPNPPVVHKPVEVRAPVAPAAIAPVVADRPSEAFRAAQAARAQKVVTMTQRPTPKAPAPSAHIPAIATTAPAKTPRSAHAAPKAAPAQTKECPHCWGVVPTAAPKCRCGYEFSGGPDLPGLALSAADLALFQGLDLGTNGKPR